MRSLLMSLTFAASKQKPVNPEDPRNRR